MNTAFFLNALVAYFVIVDPIGVSLIFSTLTQGKDASYRRTMAFRAVMVSLVLVLCFGFWGLALLRQLGIETDSFKIAGGLLLFYAAFNMVVRPEGISGDRQGSVQEDISIFPLSIPLIAGPGCLTLTVLLFSRAKEQGEGMPALVAAIIVIYALTLICFLSSDFFTRIIGKAGNNVMKRLLGVLLASLSVQFIADGIKGILG